jgi:hypothetical protein
MPSKKASITIEKALAAKTRGRPKKIKVPYGDLPEDPIKGPEPLPKAKKPMKFTDFKIGETFYTASGEWEVVDIGSKTVIALNKKYGPTCLFPETYWTIFMLYDIPGCMTKAYKPFVEKV